MRNSAAIPFSSSAVCSKNMAPIVRNLTDVDERIKANKVKQLIERETFFESSVMKTEHQIN